MRHEMVLHAHQLMVGLLLPSHIPVIAVSVMLVTFIVVAIWRFSREEF
jgi:hypothetical protein